MKHETKNRSGLKLVIQVDEPENPKGLVFIMHGMSGFKEQYHIVAFKEAFLENNYRVVRFDATNALGESDGDMMNVTYDNYISDLEDVIEWARSQVWFQQPFALCGHSMGAQSTAWYAAHHPEEVSLLVPMAPPINYELYSATMDKNELREWRSNGFKLSNSRSKPGITKQVGWGVVESIKKFDLLPFANRLSMPVLDIVGSEDEPCPPAHQEIFMNHVGSEDKKLVVVPGLEHSYRNASTGRADDGLDTIKDTLKEWLSDRS